MKEGIENINHTDIIWTYTATFLKIGAGVLLLPFLLHKLPTETVGIWNIFQVIMSLIAMLDFGFQPSFTRNISYIFSGAKQLLKQGCEHIEADAPVDYSLLKGTIRAMKRFYSLIALIAFILLCAAGTPYLHGVLQNYSGDTNEIYISWALLIAINSFNLYTFYYDSLLMGKGLVKRVQQINIISQLSYLLVAVTLLYLNFGLIAIVASQCVSILLRRILSHTCFYTDAMRRQLNAVQAQDGTQILKAILPNAIKLGIASLAGFAIYKSAVLIGSYWIPLELMASYGVTYQLVDILVRCANVYYVTYMPKIAEHRSHQDIPALKKIYTRSIGIMLGVFLLGSLALVLLGNPALTLVQSQTLLLPTQLLCFLLLVHLLECNHVISWGFILADNKVPFMIPSVVAAVVSISLMFVFVRVLDWGIAGLIAAPFIAQLMYQNWKWPVAIIRELWFTPHA